MSKPVNGVVSDSASADAAVSDMMDNRKKAKYTPDEISRFARRDELPEGGLHPLDHLLWYKLRDIYNEHAMGVITAADGAERKREALLWAEQEWEKQCRSDAMVYRCASLWKNVEGAVIAYRKDRSVKNADLIVLAIYGAELSLDTPGQEPHDACAKGGEAN